MRARAPPMHHGLPMPLASINTARFSAKALAPYLDASEPDRAEACRRVANLLYEAQR